MLETPHQTLLHRQKVAGGQDLDLGLLLAEHHVDALAARFVGRGVVNKHRRHLVLKPCRLFVFL